MLAHPNLENPLVVIYKAMDNGFTVRSYLFVLHSMSRLRFLGFQRGQPFGLGHQPTFGNYYHEFISRQLAPCRRIFLPNGFKPCSHRFPKFTWDLSGRRGQGGQKAKPAGVRYRSWVSRCVYG
jgi:hypothetical protein